MNARTRKVALTEGVTAGILFGTASIFIRLLPSLDSFSITVWRLVIACAALSTVLIVLRKKFDIDLAKKYLRDLFILGFFLCLHFILFISAVKDTTILNATVLVNTTPIFSVFVSSFIFKLNPSRLAIVGLMISFIGVSTIAYAETTAAGAFSNGVSPSIKGDLEAVLAALAETFYLNYGRRIRNQMSIVSIMLPLYAFTAFFAVILAVPVRNAVLVLPDSIGASLMLLGLGLMPTAIAHTLYFSSLSNLKSFETAAMALLEPVGATILGVAVFLEVPAPLFALGAAMVLIGIFFIGKEKG